MTSLSLADQIYDCKTLMSCNSMAYNLWHKWSMVVFWPFLKRFSSFSSSLFVRAYCEKKIPFFRIHIDGRRQFGKLQFIDFQMFRRHHLIAMKLNSWASNTCRQNMFPPVFLPFSYFISFCCCCSFFVHALPLMEGEFMHSFSMIFCSRKYEKSIKFGDKVCCWCFLAASISIDFADNKWIMFSNCLVYSSHKISDTTFSIQQSICNCSSLY